MHQQKYGATDTATEEKQLDKESQAAESTTAEKQLEWESRGTITGIAIDVLCLYAYPFFLLLPLLVGASGFRDQLGQCSANCGLGGCWKAQLLACEYTKAFVICFPALASVIILCLIGRDFLLKRLYYGFLKAGGILQFGKNAPYKDLLMVCLGLSFVHCLGFVCMSSPVLYHMEELAALTGKNGGENTKDLTSGLRSLMVALATFIPIAMISVQVYSAYDLQCTLVPLSEYVQDANDPQKMGQLEVMSDHTLNRLLDEQGNHILEGGRGLRDRYRELVSDFKKLREGTSLENLENVPSIGIQRSFWPAKLLLSKNIPDKFAKNFQVLWHTYTIGSLIWLVYVGIYICGYSIEVARQILNGRFELIAVMLVIICHVVALGRAFTSFSMTLSG